MKARTLCCALVLGVFSMAGVAHAESPNCVDDEGSFVGQATEIQDIAELDDGTLYAVDGEKAHVFRRSFDGLFYTVAGGARGHADGSMAEARFMGPYGIASGGDRLYIVDTRGQRLRVLLDEHVYTVAGDGRRGFKDGPGATARFAHPVDAVVLPSGAILVADKLNHAIRRIIVGVDPTSSVVQTVAGNGLPGSVNGPSDVAQFRWPVGVAVGPDDSIYVADQGNHAIRRIWPDGVVTTWAGGTYGYYSASKHAARLGYLGRITSDSAGWLYITDRVLPGVLSVDPDGLVTPLTGTGIGSGTGNAGGSHYRFPEGITVTSAGEVLVADIGNGGVKALSSCGSESTLQGSACVGPVCDMTLDDTYGCTDSSATNHDPNAELDNGSCVYACDPPCQNGGNCNAVGHCVCTGTGHHGPTCAEPNIASCQTGAGPAFEVCDGVDNDCNGLIDDAIGTVSCGIGGCAQTVDACANGIELNCDPEALKADEVCDGIDNDCDGQTDEGQGAAYCGFGVCKRLVSGCIDGVPTDCDPFDGASDEICNTLDDDCDGKVDEGFGEVLCGTGVCRHVQQNCIAGVTYVCEPFKGAYGEVCDGLDNDCDGETDEGTGQLTCGVGECHKTIDTCVGGVPQSCNATAGASPEICDNLDNDCNGLTDDSLMQISCGKGACAHSVPNCVDGVTQVCDPMAGAKAEVCGDGIDDDCDGVPDDGCPADDDGDGYGVDVDCDDANPTVHPGAAEACDDGKDNDCDGQTDEGCTIDLDSDGYSSEVDCDDQNSAVFPGAVEKCNGTDDDCDGQVDDNLGQTSCGIGACAHTVDNCVDGTMQACDPTDGISSEICDGKDNDCDGATDEGDACFVLDCGPGAYSLDNVTCVDCEPCPIGEERWQCGGLINAPGPGICHPCSPGMYKDVVGDWNTACDGSGYKLFTSGTSSWKMPTGVTNIRIVAIGGGGGGGSHHGGGGGSGEVKYAEATVVGGELTVLVGGGGGGGGTLWNGIDGSVGSISAIGDATGDLAVAWGGKGGYYGQPQEYGSGPGGAGGSGGGGSNRENYPGCRGATNGLDTPYCFGGVAQGGASSGFDDLAYITRVLVTPGVGGAGGTSALPAGGGGGGIKFSPGSGVAGSIKTTSTVGGSKGSKGWSGNGGAGYGGGGGGGGCTEFQGCGNGGDGAPGAVFIQWVH